MGDTYIRGYIVDVFISPNEDSLRGPQYVASDTCSYSFDLNTDYGVYWIRLQAYNNAGLSNWIDYGPYVKSYGTPQFLEVLRNGSEAVIDSTTAVTLSWVWNRLDVGSDDVKDSYGFGSDYDGSGQFTVNNKTYTFSRYEFQWSEDGENWIAFEDSYDASKPHVFDSSLLNSIDVRSVEIRTPTARVHNKGLYYFRMRAVFKDGESEIESEDYADYNDDCGFNAPLGREYIGWSLPITCKITF